MRSRKIAAILSIGAILSPSIALATTFSFTPTSGANAEVPVQLDVSFGGGDDTNLHDYTEVTITPGGYLGESAGDLTGSTGSGGYWLTYQWIGAQGIGYTADPLQNGGVSGLVPGWTLDQPGVYTTRFYHSPTADFGYATPPPTPNCPQLFTLETDTRYPSYNVPRTLADCQNADATTASDSVLIQTLTFTILNPSSPVPIMGWMFGSSTALDFTSPIASSTATGVKSLGSIAALVIAIPLSFVVSSFVIGLIAL